MPTIPVDPHVFHRALMTLEDCVIGGARQILDRLIVKCYC